MRVVLLFYRQLKQTAMDENSTAPLPLAEAVGNGYRVVIAQNLFRSEPTQPPNPKPVTMNHEP